MNNEIIEGSTVAVKTIKLILKNMVIGLSLFVAYRAIICDDPMCKLILLGYCVGGLASIKTNEQSDSAEACGGCVVNLIGLVLGFWIYSLVTVAHPTEAEARENRLRHAFDSIQIIGERREGVQK